jgi:hypothetical protein
MVPGNPKQSYLQAEELSVDYVWDCPIHSLHLIPLLARNTSGINNQSKCHPITLGHHEHHASPISQAAAAAKQALGWQGGLRLLHTFSRGRMPSTPAAVGVMHTANPPGAPTNVGCCVVGLLSKQLVPSVAHPAASGIPLSCHALNACQHCPNTPLAAVMVTIQVHR